MDCVVDVVVDAIGRKQRTHGGGSVFFPGSVQLYATFVQRGARVPA